jgi:hypothetical protein
MICSVLGVLLATWAAVPEQYVQGVRNFLVGALDPIIRPSEGSVLWPIAVVAEHLIGIGAGAPYARQMPQRRFPRPWRFETIPGGYRVIDANGLPLAHVYGQPPDAVAFSADKQLTDNGSGPPRSVAVVDAGVIAVPPIVTAGDHRPLNTSSSPVIPAAPRAHATSSVRTLSEPWPRILPSTGRRSSRRCG